MAANNESAVLFDQPGPKGRKTIRIINWIAGIIFAIVVVLILMRLHNPPDGENQLSWELWKPALDPEAWTDFYLPGLWPSIFAASLLAVVGAVVFGLVFGIGRLMPNPLVRAVSGADCRIRASSARAAHDQFLLALVRLRRPAQPRLLVGSCSPWIIYNGSVVAELVRSGVGNLPDGQREASLALGLTQTQSLMQIEVPQAIVAMLPAAVTQLVVVLKDTALGSIIMYTDLLQQSRRLGSMYFNILQTLVVAGVDLLHRLLAAVATGRMAAVQTPAAHRRADRARAGGADRGGRPLQRQPDRRGQGGRGAAARRHRSPIPCASSRHQRLHPPVEADQIRAGVRCDAPRIAGGSRQGEAFQASPQEERRGRVTLALPA